MKMTENAMNKTLLIGAGLAAAVVLALGLRPGGGDNVTAAPSPNPPKAATAGGFATFAGGCFWCVEADFEKVPGVISAVSGYTGGQLEKPSYKQVSAGGTGHLEAVQVHYDPDRISYEGLLQAFWRMINPTDPGGQFVDRGHQYSTAIFVHDDSQRAAAERSKAQLAASGRYDQPLVTPILPAQGLAGWGLQVSPRDSL